MGTKILRCTCANDFQDKTYGKGKRVHNRMQDEPSGRPQYRCTACKKVQSTNKERKAKDEPA